MTITQFEVFVKVVDTGSFTKAGEQLNMTQSAVSHAVKGLESELGVVLLIRDRRRGLQLSDVGKRILMHAREILNRIRHIEQEATTASGINVGTLRIGSFASASIHLLPKIISLFHSQYPNVDIRLFDGTYQEVREWLLSHVIDIGFSTFSHPELEFMSLTKDRMVVVLPEDHSLLKRSSIQLTDLANEPLIKTKSGSEEIINQMFQQAKLTQNTLFEVQDSGTILSMIKEGLGITIAPELALPQEQPGVTYRNIDPLVWRQIGLSCLSIKEASPAVKAFIEIASQLYKEEG